MNAAALDPDPLALLVEGVCLRAQLLLEHQRERRREGSPTLASCPPGETWAAIRKLPTTAPRLERLARIDARLAADQHGRMAQTRLIFHLDQGECDLVAACLAWRREPLLRRACRRLDGFAAMSESLAAALFGHDTPPWSAASPLRLWRLVVEVDAGPVHPPALRLDRHLFDWLYGAQALDDRLVGMAAMVEPHPPLARWPVAATAEAIQAALAASAQPRVRIGIAGPRGSGRRTFAAAVAARLGLGLIAIDAARCAVDSWDELHLHAQRQAFLSRSALAWVDGAKRPSARLATVFPVQFELGDAESDGDAQAVDLAVSMPEPMLDERRDLWARYVPASAAWDGNAFTAMANRTHVTVGDIVSVSSHGIVTVDAAAAHVRAASRARIGDLAQRLECPFAWDDLVVTERLREQLADLVYEAEQRVSFWERPEARRLFPQGRGLVALLSGPPGTGKTMAAQVLAARLGLDLYRVHVPAVVSKYIGETAKNLSRVLAETAREDVVLFFDECDALFTKRTEVQDSHDRFANADTNVLLQAVESFPGLALLATNRKDNLDAAFLRRLRFDIEFPKPDAAQRYAMWRRMLDGLAPGHDLVPSLGNLAEAVDLTGAQIKYAVLTAVFAASSEDSTLSPRHLVKGIERELAKEGRALGGRLRERLG